ncbi:S-acyltransferase [Quillaja saponaria]|uniref:S-acyltransferase n=1 Tax=Quillaja saponaria TaxID=32244 RepID=A0AAD7KQC7_QUISA|nr:S-acyltransferase [Quillaja saponaria]
MGRSCSMFPCLADPARRSSLFLKMALVTVHLIYAGVLFLFDGGLIEKTRKEPWYTALYLLLFVATLVQYFVASLSSPGYVLDAMRAVNERDAVYRKTYTTSKQPASSKNGNFIVTLDGSQLGSSLLGSNSTSWSKLVADLYPPGTTIRTWTCTYCNVEQPPRAKHCHDCDKCVLQFDHHCVWLGNCIGQGNHCRFWWFICEESALCLWTGILYISYLKAYISRACYLILTNQTTYELVRRRRIFYLRGIPERVYPFSKGVCRNLYNFCFARSSIYSMERLPTLQELEEMSMPHTCWDVVACRYC